MNYIRTLFLLKKRIFTKTSINSTYASAFHAGEDNLLNIHFEK